MSSTGLNAIGKNGEKTMGLQRKRQAIGFERCEDWGVSNYSVEERVRGMGKILGWTFEVEFTAYTKKSRG